MFLFVFFITELFFAVFFILLLSFFRYCVVLYHRMDLRRPLSSLSMEGNLVYHFNQFINFEIPIDCT